jgi:hypothetical protein
MRAYIGEADSVRDRIAQSANTRAFWESAVVVTTSDEALTKGHVRYLEARLIEQASKAGRVLLDNGQFPASGKRFLPEADRANMEAFLANLKVVLPVVGLDLLKAKPEAAMKSPTQISASEAKFEIRHKSGIRAIAVEEEGEFVVLEGSRSLKNAGYQSNTYGELKQELIAQGVLKDSVDGNSYVFSKSFSFKSPSAAAAVVLDRTSNGRTEWKLVGSKSTYHEWQEAKAGLSESSSRQRNQLSQ